MLSVRLMRKIVLFAILSAILLSCPAWAWFAEGHEITAIIAGDDLTPTARSHVAEILKSIFAWNDFI